MRYLAVLLLLSACAVSPERQACLSQYPAPPSPNASRGANSGILGAIIGGVIDERRPENAAWRANMNNCQRGYADANR